MLSWDWQPAHRCSCIRWSASWLLKAILLDYGFFFFMPRGEHIVGERVSLNFHIPVDALKFWLTHNRSAIINNAPKSIFIHFHLACCLSPGIECDLPWSWRKWDHWVQVYHLLPSEAATLVWDNKGMLLCSHIELVHILLSSSPFSAKTTAY